MVDSRTTPEGDKERAGVLIGMALQKHKEVVGNDRMKLEAAIDAGKALLEAREMYAHDDNGKRQWGKKLKECWKGSTPRTAYRYMDIAKHEELVRADFDTRVKNDAKDDELHKWSIRSALDLIAKEKKGNGDEDKDGEKDKPPPKPPISTAPASPDLTSMLENVDVDEVGSVINAKWDSDKRSQLVRRLGPTPPKGLVEEAKTIIAKLGPAELDQIASYIADLIEQKAAA